MRAYWQWGWMLQHRSWYSWMLHYYWCAAHIVASDYFYSVHLYTVGHGCLPAQWSCRKSGILGRESLYFYAIIFPKNAFYQELPLLQLSNQAHQLSQSQKIHKVSSSWAERPVVTMLGSTAFWLVRLGAHYHLTAPTWKCHGIQVVMFNRVQTWNKYF